VPVVGNVGLDICQVMWYFRRMGKVRLGLSVALVRRGCLSSGRLLRRVVEVQHLVLYSGSHRRGWFGLKVTSSSLRILGSGLRYFVGH
jgi:hypothetical protein